MSNITIIAICITIGLICNVLGGIILIIMEGRGMDWIDVNDAEPQEDEVYLITWYGYLLGTKTREFIEIAEYDGAEWCVDHIAKRGYKDIRVTAWMPLPDPYKQEVEE